mgnify:CR=1 FL=1
MIPQSFTIVGILNVTPDSYHDGGKFVHIDSALKRALELAEEGADIIEIGGESTGPKSKDVSVDEELARVLPVIRAIRSALPDQSLSVDTYKSEIAKAVLAEGVGMINDVTAGRSDSKIFTTVADAGAKLVLMFAKDPMPRTTIAETQYDDVIRTIKTFLKDRKKAAMNAGVHEASIILDPGLGHFVSSDPQYSFEILQRLSEFLDLGSPLFLSPSRKSFLAGAENLTTADRLPGTIAASVIAMLNGARYIRTHDVAEVRRACEIASRMQN